MRTRGSSARRRRWQLLALPALCVAVAGQIGLTGTVAARAASTVPAGTVPASTVPASTAASASVTPNPVNELDCNGWSPKYGTVRKMAGELCTDPLRLTGGKAAPFVDNGWYVGHDEPAVKFISSTPGSGNTMTYLTRIPVDPRRAPTASGSVTHYAELSVAPWFGLPMCDPNSYPQNPCTPDSDRNVGLNVPNAAGSAFMELQFYPPGFTPFIDSVSCSKTKWCAALNIDSLECNFNQVVCNNNCPEPVNFAYLQTNGVPAGPPNPQRADVSTMLPNSRTLMINPGDTLRVSISDPGRGFTTVVRDLTTHQTGFMTASAANGFMNTDMTTCNGTPFTFHAEYSTAKINNRVPWAVLEGGVLMQQEIGHSEVCNSVTNRDPLSAGFPGGQSYTDRQVFDTCVGGSDGPGARGEGPCNPQTGICQNAKTQGPNGPRACPTGNSLSQVRCEYADGFCFQKGTRTTLVNGVPTPMTAAANWCNAGRFQNGDLDYDGVDYQPGTWPNGTASHPTSFQYVGPFQANGRPYPQIQFETSASGSEFLCNTNTGAGCVVPPAGSRFYPFWSLSPTSTALGSHTTRCVWNFGNVLPSTISTFGRDAQYGPPDLSWFGGTNISRPMTNPQFSGGCRR